MFDGRQRRRNGGEICDEWGENVRKEKRREQEERREISK